MTTSQTWTTEQDDYLRQHYASTPTADLAEVLGRANAARAWAPVCAYGQGEHAPLPPGARPVALKMPTPKAPDPKDHPPKPTERTAHLAIPVTRCRTTFAGGVNPWVAGHVTLHF